MLELSSHLFEISINAYTVVVHSKVLQAGWLIQENNEKATLHITCPIVMQIASLKDEAVWQHSQYQDISAFVPVTAKPILIHKLK